MEKGEPRRKRKPPISRKVCRILDAAERSLRTGDTDEAMDLFQMAVQADRGDVRPRLRLAISLGELGRALEALGALEEAAKTDPACPAVWLRLGVLQGDLGRTEEALASLKQCLDLSPKNPLARAYLSLYDPDVKVMYSDESAPVAGGWLWDDGFVARLALEAERCAGGISRDPAVTPVEVSPDVAPPGTRKARSDAHDLLRSAEGMLRRGLYRSAAEHVERALSLDKGLGNRARFPLACAYFGLNEWKKVEEVLSAFEGTGTKKGKAEELLGEVARRDGRFEEALSHFDSALPNLETDPWDRACVSLFRALTLVALGRLDDARLAFETFMRTAPIDLKYEISQLAFRNLTPGEAGSNESGDA